MHSRKSLHSQTRKNVQMSSPSKQNIRRPPRETDARCGIDMARCKFDVVQTLELATPVELDSAIASQTSTRNRVEKSKARPGLPNVFPHLNELYRKSQKKDNPLRWFRCSFIEGALYLSRDRARSCGNFCV